MTNLFDYTLKGMENEDRELIHQTLNLLFTAARTSLPLPRPSMPIRLSAPVSKKAQKQDVKK